MNTSEKPESARRTSKPLARLLVFLVVLVAVFATVLTPSLQYDPRTETLAEASAGSPAQRATDLLLAETGMSGARIEAQRVRIRSGSSLLAALLDDDPTCVATVELEVRTPAGDSRLIDVHLWDYGLVLPWAVRPQGDGWKLVSAG